MEWVRFFVGTPRRVIATFAVVAMIVVLVWPGLLRFAAERLTAELMPLLGPAMIVVIVIVGLKFLLFGGGRR